MANYNKVILMGNLTRDPELRSTSNNKSVCNLGLAVNRHYKDAGGDKQEETTFVNAEAWGSTAETINKHLKKGSPMFLEGRLRLDQWEGSDGDKHSKLKVVVESFQFIGPRPEKDG